MKKTHLTIALIIFTTIVSSAYADFTDMYGAYESVWLRDRYATKKNITHEEKDAYERMRVSITINENKVIIILGGNKEDALEMNYYIIKKDFILAYDDSLINVMYRPIYFKNNIIYTMGQSFEKN